jgi:hypothetical protein
MAAPGRDRRRVANRVEAAFATSIVGIQAP